jgi:predicted Na+-dependent transporter
MSCQKTGHCHAPCGQDRRLAGVSCTVALERFTLLFPLWTLLGQPQAVRRTVSIEVGMQNSGLAVVHAVLGSVLASWWRGTLR